MPAFYGPMLAPVTDLAVTSLADFSARRAPGAASGATAEGLARQCFDKVCCHPHHKRLNRGAAPGAARAGLAWRYLQGELDLLHALRRPSHDLVCLMANLHEDWLLEHSVHLLRSSKEVPSTAPA